MFLEITQNSQKNICARVSVPEACNFIKKEALTQVFSCESCEISKNTFSAEHLCLNASESNLIFPEIRKLLLVYIENQGLYFHLPPITLKRWELTLVTSFLWSNSIFVCQTVVHPISKLWTLKRVKNWWKRCWKWLTKHPSKFQFLLLRGSWEFCATF